MSLTITKNKEQAHSGLMQKLFADYIFLYLFLQPFLGLMSYYFNISFTPIINKIVIISGPLFFVLYGMVRQEKVNVKLLSFIFIFLLMPAALAVYSAIFYNIYIPAIFSHFFGSFMVVLYFSIGYYKTEVFELFAENETRIKYFIFWDLFLICIFYFNPLGFIFYPSFQSDYLIPTFIYSVFTGNNLFIIVHFCLFFFHQKRAVLIISILVFVIYHYKMGSKTRKTIVISAGVFIMIAGSIFLSQYLSKVNIKDSQQLVRYYAIYDTFESLSNQNQSGGGKKGDNVDTSFLEKMNEVIGALKLKKDAALKIFGNGFGWQFFLKGDDGLIRGRIFMHFTIFFIYTTYGFLGVALYLYIFYNCLKVLFISKDKKKLYYAFAVFTFFIGSFSTLNFFTQPLYSLLVGSFYKNLKS